MKKILLILSLGICFCSAVWGRETNQLQGIDLKSLSGNKLELILQFSEEAVYPTSFSVETPPTVVLDFDSVQNKLTKEMASKILTGNLIKNINIAEANGKTRLSIDLEHVLPFRVEGSGTAIKITFDESAEEGSVVSGSLISNPKYGVNSFDFKRGERGEGQLILDLSDPKTNIDVKDENGVITVEFLGAKAVDSITQKYDVTDFGTPAQKITLSNDEDKVKMIVETLGKYSQISYQMDNQFVLEVNDATREDFSGNDTLKRYSGEKISLNFQDIGVRAVLQIIADFSGFNLVTDDTVKGNVTLRLHNIPWDQALDIILRSKGLSKRQDGNVYMIGPIDQLVAREKIEFEEQKQAEDLGPVKSELMKINYSNAGDLATLLKDKTNSFLTTRGSVNVDKRTNTLLVQDVEHRLAEIRTLIKKIDIPVRQVQISTQIVTVNNSLEKTLGVRFGGGANLGIGHRRLGVGSTAERARAIADNRAGEVPPPTPVPSNATLSGGAGGPTVANTEGLFSDLSVAKTGGGLASVGLGLARLPNGTLLDLELQAMQYESLSKTIAKPNLITQNQNKASVEQGIQIPYQSQTTGSAQAATTSFVTATLKMEVTPQITADDRITLDLNITNDSLGDAVTGTSQPSINKNNLQTKILLDNGQTAVLGGVLQVLDTRTAAKVPFFGDLPFIGSFFRNKSYKHQPKELVVFLTPRIINTVDTDQ